MHRCENYNSAKSRKEEHDSSKIDQNSLSSSKVHSFTQKIK